MLNEASSAPVISPSASLPTRCGRSRRPSLALIESTVVVRAICGRIDLTVTKPHTGEDGKPAVQREVVELKVRRQGDRNPLKEALAQLDEYLYRLDLDHGILIIFDRRPSVLRKRPVPGFSSHRTPDDRAITLLAL